MPLPKRGVGLAMYGPGRRVSIARRPAAVCALLLLVAGAADGTAATGGPEALDLAFRFASAIVSDDKDRARAQEEVVRGYAARGAFAEALAAASRIEGWRQGTAFADLAAALAGAGREEEARELVARAEQLRAATSGWQGVRIGAHVAAALGTLGEAERAASIAAGLVAHDRQYAGRAAAIAAGALARNGDPGAALQRLAPLDGDPDFEVAWWRTGGYLEVARHAGKDAAARDRALESARRSADGIAGWKSAEALVRVAEENVRAGGTPAARPDSTRMGEARDALRRAEAIARSLPATMPVRARLLADVARGWMRTGVTRQARRLVREAEASVAETLRIDRPGLYATVAAAAAAAGDREAADRLFGRALEEAEGLRNARPRALAAVEICTVLGREGRMLDGTTRGRLERILGGLGEPW
jgi:hypothetical protein